MSAQYTLPRDHVAWALKLARRMLRFWWVVGATVAIGTVATFFYVKERRARYLSEAVVYYQEPVNINIGDSTPTAKKMGQRLKETILARSRLAQLIEELDLHPEKRRAGKANEIVEIVRKEISFRVSEGDTYVISYLGETPELAQTVTQRLTDTLIEENSRLRTEQAEIARGFLDAEGKRLQEVLHEKELEMGRFLSKHPEFGVEAAAVAGLAPRGATPVPVARRPVVESGASSDPVLSALKREEQRIKVQLSPAGGAAATAVDPTLLSAKRDAEARLATARRELTDRQARFTEEHPDVRAAASLVRQHEESVKLLDDAVKTAQGTGSPAQALSDEARATLQTRLAQVQQEIRSHRGRGDGAAAPPSSDTTNRIVAVDGEWTRLQRELNDARERYDALDTRQFVATLTASSLSSGRVARIVVIDPAFLPARPVGARKLQVALIGFAASIVLGLGLAVVLAVLDDRLLDGHDVERLGLAPFVVGIPPWRGLKRRARSAA